MASMCQPGCSAQRRFGEGLDAHDARQHRGTVNAMIVEERLDLRIEGGLHRQTAVNAHSGDLADHRSLRRQLPGG